MQIKEPSIKWERYEALWVLQDDDEFQILINTVKAIFFEYRNLLYRGEFCFPYYDLKRLTFDPPSPSYIYWNKYQDAVFDAFDRFIDGVIEMRKEFAIHKQEIFYWLELKSDIYNLRLLCQFLVINLIDWHVTEEINYIALEDLTDEQREYFYGKNGI